MPEAVAMKPVRSTGGLGSFERYLSVWVALCMAGGIGLEKLAPAPLPACGESSSAEAVRSMHQSPGSSGS